jgi:hypothetical protein
MHMVGLFISGESTWQDDTIVDIIILVPSGADSDPDSDSFFRWWNQGGIQAKFK